MGSELITSSADGFGIWSVWGTTSPTTGCAFGAAEKDSSGLPTCPRSRRAPGGFHSYAAGKTGAPLVGEDGMARVTRQRRSLPRGIPDNRSK